MSLSDRPEHRSRLAGRAVGRMGFGAMQLAERAGQQAPSTETATAVLSRAVELGVNHIDTATAGIHLDAATMATPDELATVAS